MDHTVYKSVTFPYSLDRLIGWNISALTVSIILEDQNKFFVPRKFLMKTSSELATLFRASPGGNHRLWSGFCRRSGPWYRVRDLHYHLFSPFFSVSFFFIHTFLLSSLCSTTLKFKIFFLTCFYLANISSTNFFFSRFDANDIIFQHSHLSSWDILLSFSTIPPYNYFYLFICFLCSLVIFDQCVL